MPGHFDIVVMAAYVLYALALQFGDALRMKDELFQFIAHTLVRRLYVDNRAQFVLSQYLVVLGFTATYADNTLRHSQQRIHGWCVAVELVQDGVATVHQFLVFVERDTLRLDEFHLIGMRTQYILGRP